MGKWCGPQVGLPDMIFKYDVLRRIHIATPHKLFSLLPPEAGIMVSQWIASYRHKLHPKHYYALYHMIDGFYNIEVPLDGEG